jgi:hypothetical protein
MPYPVKGTCKIQFDYHAFFFPGLARMDGLLDKDDIVADVSAFDEASLIIRDNCR